MNAEDLSSLMQVSKEGLHYFPRGGAGYDYIAKGAVDAMEKQAANQEKRDELARWLRYSDAEKEEKKDGLPAEQLGITGIMQALWC